jgi:hypothetical protein
MKELKKLWCQRSSLHETYQFEREKERIFPAIKFLARTACDKSLQLEALYGDVKASQG